MKSSFFFVFFWVLDICLGLNLSSDSTFYFQESINCSGKFVGIKGQSKITTNESFYHLMIKGAQWHKDQQLSCVPLWFQASYYSDSEGNPPDRSALNYLITLFKINMIQYVNCTYHNPDTKRTKWETAFIVNSPSILTMLFDRTPNNCHVVFSENPELATSSLELSGKIFENHCLAHQKHSPEFKGHLSLKNFDFREEKEANSIFVGSLVFHVENSGFKIYNESFSCEFVWFGSWFEIANCSKENTRDPKIIEENFFFFEFSNHEGAIFKKNQFYCCETMIILHSNLQTIQIWLLSLLLLFQLMAS